MSKITAVYDAILEKVPGLFPEKIMLPDPYDIANNANHELTNGLGVAVGTAIPEDYDFCNMMVNRNFIITLTHEKVALKSDAESNDPVSKLFLEEVYQIQRLLYSYSELDIEADIVMVEQGEVSGIENVSPEKSNFLKMSASFTFKVRELI